MSVNFTLRRKAGAGWQQPHTITVLSPSSVFTLFVCLLVLLALLLVFSGVAGIALGPILVMMGWSLLKFAVGMLLLMFLFRLVMRLLQTLFRATRTSPAARQFATQVRPWLHLCFTLIIQGIRAFIRWYQDQQGGA
jgi:hypothetical protein